VAVSPSERLPQNLFSSQGSFSGHGSFLKRPNPSQGELLEKHRALKLELGELMRRGTLTPQEQDRARALKKLKLLAKDRLQEFSR